MDDMPLDLSKTKRHESVDDRPLDLSLKPRSSPPTTVSITKMVRGQDEWLNNSKNNFISQILKCLECSKSFTSLSELSLHMYKTKHYLKSPTAASTATTPKMLQHKKTALLKPEPQTTTALNHSNNIFIKNSIMTKTSNLLCLICSKYFTNGIKLIEHIQNSHKISQICTSCGAYFETYDEYHKHLVNENYHHSNHHHHQHSSTRRASLCSSMSKRKQPQQQHQANENQFKKFKIEHDESSSRKEDKNPLVALELLVNSKIDGNSKNGNNGENVNSDENKNNPLNLLSKMQSSITSYVL